MSTENHQDQSKSSLTNVNSSPKMQGWYKLVEKIRKDPPSNELPRSLLNSNLNKTLSKQQNSFSNNSSNSNGYILRPSETNNTHITLDSPPNIFTSPSIISVASTPRQNTDEPSFIDIEPVLTPSLGRELEMESTASSSSSSSSISPPSTDSKESPKRSKKITIRRSTKSKERPVSNMKSVEISTPITEDISDDDMPISDIRKHKKTSIDTLSIPSMSDSIIPLATDIQSLPGHTQQDHRDIRFLNYTDIDNLAIHLNTCLIIEKKSFSSTKQLIFKTRYNVLNKIFKIYYLKTFRRNLVLEKKSYFNKKDSQKQQPLSVISSPTTTSFKIDWNVNRRNSLSTQRQIPNNTFHILQLNPKTNFSLSTNSSSSSSSSITTTTTKSPIQTFESIKDILARTYYPHLYTAIEYGYQFGAKSIFPNTQQLITTHDDITSIKQRPESPYFMNDSTIITLKSPPSTTRRISIPFQQSPSSKSRRISNPFQQSPNKSEQNQNTIKSSISIEHHSSENIEEISSIVIKKSMVVLTPTKIPSPSSPSLIEKEKKLNNNNNNNNRKRKSSTITNNNIIEKKKKRVISLSSSSDIINQYEDITNSESEEEEMLPSQLPKQSFIKNGLRSNYYKTLNDNDLKSISKNRTKRRRRQSSGSLPSFYTGIFQSDDDEKSPHIDYCLPYDIYWQNQQKLHNNSSSISINSHKKKKSTQPKQKQPLPYRKIFRNVYTDQIKQNILSSYNIENAPICDCKPPDTCEDGICVNKLLFTECLSTCICGNRCSNQKIRKNQWFKNLEIFDTGKYGQGLRTTSNISKGTFICEYVGEIITDEKFHERMINLYSKDEHHYTMKLTQNYVIDAYRMGSIARFANHSCLPNCEFQKWTVDGLQRMCMFSLRTIKAGEELTYDYNFRCFNLQSQQPCYCENLKCRGTIGAKQPIITSSPSITTTNNNHQQQQQSITIQKLSQREKRMILQSSIFLLRNLRKLKEKYRNKKLKRQIDKQPALSLFLTQNYYHSNRLNTKSTLTSLRKTPKLSHKEIFYLFYNHVRHSHFFKSGRYQYELIDDKCYYAQLAQLTLIFNEIFDLIIHYKSINDDVIPSVILQKCPSKRLVPTYYEIITKPIDLIIIKNRLDNGEYLTFNLFEHDLILLFKNAITFCGEDSDEARVVLELQDYFLNTLKLEYKMKLNLFRNIKREDRTLPNLHTLENFIGHLHEKEVMDGQIREVLYDIIYCIDNNSNNNTSPIVYKIVLGNNNNSHRTSRSKISSDCIVHCRCGSVYDENSLVQCYACQLWQHVACVSINDPSRPYYCFECQPTCDQNPLACLKTNVLIAATLSPLQTYDDDNHSSYSTLTRSDGFIIRINECYFVPKQDENNIDRSLISPQYDILCVERLWIDDYGIGQASGFYYIRPNETFHEPTRKFFPNEVFRFPTSNDPLPISSFVRPCFVLDIKTYSKGKPISDNSSRVLSSDIFICEYRVDKNARTFTRLVKSRQFGINTKSYCFDNYVDKPVIKRDYQPYQKEVQQYHYDNRRRSTGNSIRLNPKQLKEKNTRINGLIEKIYYRFHDQNSIPNDNKNHTIDQLFQPPPPSSSSSILIDDKISSSSPAGNINQKRRTISLSSDDDIVELIPENDCQKPLKKRCTKQTNKS